MESIKESHDKIIEAEGLQFFCKKDNTNPYMEFFGNLGPLGLIERSFFAIFKKLNIDASGRLRVSAESVASHAVTLASTVVSEITTWGITTAQARSQWESHLAFQQGFRRNLVHTV